MDKVVVVTGASAGIGAERARQLAAGGGAKVVLAARPSVYNGRDSITIFKPDRVRQAASEEDRSWMGVWP
jgi:NAD(P)-dependent dehydrogenase (short-subunit alcohol dehydrogenase family)